jgi:conjugal transfer pilus assembly protein TraF
MSRSIVMWVCLSSHLVCLPAASATPSESAIETLSKMTAEQAPAREPRFIHRHAEGWFWRDVDPEEKEPEALPDNEPESAAPAASLYPPMDSPLDDPLAALKSLQKAVETAQARAVLQPTEANLMAWMTVQNELFRKNTLFADGLQRLVWKNPEFDYNQVRPSNPVALAAYSESYNTDRRDALREIARDYGLYFFVSGDCAYCHAMAPYLKRFAEAYGFVVIAVSVDGGTVDGYSNAKYSPEFAEQLGVKQTPAIFLAKPNEHIVEPIAYGYISVQELESRIYRLFRLKPGEPNYQVNTTRMTP